MLVFSFCSPSLGPTSIMRTWSARALGEVEKVRLLSWRPSSRLAGAKDMFVVFEVLLRVNSTPWLSRSYIEVLSADAMRLCRRTREPSRKALSANVSFGRASTADVGGAHLERFLSSHSHSCNVILLRLCKSALPITRLLRGTKPDHRRAMCHGMRRYPKRPPPVAPPCTPFP